MDAEPWVVEVLKMGYLVPFSLPPPLSLVPISLPRYSPTSIKRNALRGEVSALVAKGAVELAPTSPVNYSRLFVVGLMEACDRPVSSPKFFLQTRLKMESNQSVLCMVQRSDWMVSIDLKDACLQVSIHPDN